MIRRKATRFVVRNGELHYKLLKKNAIFLATNGNTTIIVPSRFLLKHLLHLHSNE